jgi:GAF domain-containing protein
VIAVEQLAEVFVQVADTLVEDFDIIDFLETVTDRTARMSGAAAAGLLLADPHGQLRFMAASEGSARALELFQIQSDEGPCMDCYHTGAPVINSNLTQADGRWPLFAPHAVAAGFRAVHAFPLRHRDTVIGAMNLFSHDVGDLEPSDVQVIQALAHVATIGLLQERAIRNGQILTEQLQGALNSRISVEQAKGALARIHGVDVDAAFTLMRSYARRHHHRLTDVALAVVTDPTRHPELTTSSQPDPRL